MNDLTLYNYLILHIAPWGESNTVTQKSIESARTHILEGAFGKAAGVLSDRIEDLTNPKPGTEISEVESKDLIWVYLLRSYTASLTVICGPLALQETMLVLADQDYLSARELNVELADDVDAAQTLIMTYIPDLTKMHRLYKVPINFKGIHEEAWHCYLTKCLISVNAHDRVISVATEGLNNFSYNHSLYFFRGLAWIMKSNPQQNLSYIQKADDDLTLAINCCLLIEGSEAILARYYFHRLQTRFSLDKVEEVKIDFNRLLFCTKSPEASRAREIYLNKIKELKKISPLLLNDDASPALKEEVLEVKAEELDLQVSMGKQNKKNQDKKKHQKSKRDVHFILNQIIETASQKGELLRVQKQELLDARIKEAELIEEQYREQVRVAYQPITTLTVPAVVAEFVEAIKKVPGPLSKRIYLYGFCVTKEVYSYPGEVYDYCLQSALSFDVLAPLMKKFFNLENEPAKDKGLLEHRFTLTNDQGLKRLVNLSLSHSPELVAGSTFIEALQREMYYFIYLEIAYIALFPDQGPICSVYYPPMWPKSQLAQSNNKWNPAFFSAPLSEVPLNQDQEEPFLSQGYQRLSQ